MKYSLYALCWLLLWAPLLVPMPAHAQVALDLLAGELDLAPHVAVLADGNLELAALHDAAFVPNRAREVSFGFDRAPVWLRFRAHSAREVRWMLELGEPSLDHVELFVVHGDGSLEQHRAGDALPFVERALPYARSSFELVSPAGDRATYYLHVQSDDVMRIPLRAFTPSAFAAHQLRVNGLLWAAYGALLMFIAYHLVVYWLVRRTHYLAYALLCSSFVLTLLTLYGQFAQLLAPTRPDLAARAAPVSLALACVCFVIFLTTVVQRIPEVWNPRGFRMLIYAALGLLAFCSVAPVAIALRTVAAVLFAASCGGAVILWRLAALQLLDLRPFRKSWYALVVTIPIAALRYANVLPAWSPVLDWVMPIGFVWHGLATSLALPAWALGIEGRLAAANLQLNDNVLELQRALAQARDASEQALRATKAKDEFVATMSHELRTPLNAIINLQQGLMEQFVHLRSAACKQCDTVYLLDDGENVDAETTCEVCSQRGSLVEGTRVKYVGDDARCLQFLGKIERSGQHLLTMVNDVLDFSKIESGRFDLNVAPLDLEALLREVQDQMIDLAQRKNVTLELQCAGTGRPLLADALRLKQVLLNLIANAVKFSEPNTKVTLRWVSLAELEQIEVEDRGIGIAAENHERVFASFEQVHKGDTRKYGGTGLGLSIARSLVRMHGGELSLRSELGMGSTFIVQLPHRPAAA